MGEFMTSVQTLSPTGTAFVSGQERLRNSKRAVKTTATAASRRMIRKDRLGGQQEAGMWVSKAGWEGDWPPPEGSSGGSRRGLFGL